MNDTYSDWPSYQELQGGEAQLLRGKEKVWIASNVCHPILTHSIPKKKASCHSPILYPGAALDLKIRLKVLFPTFRCAKQKFRLGLYDLQFHPIIMQSVTSQDLW